MLDIHRESDPQTAAVHAASAIAELLSGYKSIPVLFLVSGGSPLEIIKHLTTDAFDGRVTVGVSDERFDRDPTINNFTQLIQTSWYKNAVGKGVTSIDTRPIAGETVEDAGKRFDMALKTWKQNNPTGKIVITQGIGLDGHTVGIMPGFSFEDDDVWAVGYDAKEKNKYPLRVTTTMPFLRMVSDSILFVCGEEKRKPLTDTLAKKGSLAVTPARIIHEMKHCLLFTDLSVDTVKP